MVFSIFRTIIQFYVALFYFISGGSYSECKLLKNNRARINVWSLAQIFKLWNTPHYRHPSFAVDAQMNLRNVKVPYTPLPLSYLCYFGRYFVLFCLLTVYPFFSFCAAVQAVFAKGISVYHLGREFNRQLLTPDDWFSYWRLDCRLVSYLFDKTGCRDFDLENKWTFLQRATECDLPVTPWYNDMPAIIVKHINEEGGLGVHSFKNVTNGGDWIIQKLQKNSDNILRLLPEDAPFCTFRICTGYNPRTGQTTALCAVFRAGLKDATTDHSCILFDCNMETGKITGGTLQWRREYDIDHHPDTGKKIVGEVLACVPEMCDLCIRAHQSMCPSIPIVGWDVAETEGDGLMFLEANLMANLHKGKFSRSQYFEIVDANIRWLEGGADSDEYDICECESKMFLTRGS